MEEGLEFMRERIFDLIMQTEEDFLLDRDSIFKQILDSTATGNLVGITSEKLGTGMFLTSVEQVIMEDEGEVIVVLKPYDATGYIFPTNRLHLSDITSLFPFKTKFQNPYIEQTKPVEIIDTTKPPYPDMDSRDDSLDQS
jgi:hypothetical protein